MPSRIQTEDSWPPLYEPAVQPCAAAPSRGEGLTVDIWLLGWSWGCMYLSIEKSPGFEALPDFTFTGPRTNVAILVNVCDCTYPCCSKNVDAFSTLAPRSKPFLWLLGGDISSSALDQCQGKCPSYPAATSRRPASHTSSGMSWAV